VLLTANRANSSTLDALRIDASPHKSYARVNHDKIFGCKMGKLRVPSICDDRETKWAGNIEYGIASGYSYLRTSRYRQDLKFFLIITRALEVFLLRLSRTRNLKVITLKNVLVVSIRSTNKINSYHMNQNSGKWNRILRFLIIIWIFG